MVAIDLKRLVVVAGVTGAVGREAVHNLLHRPEIEVIGISRSASELKHARYRHVEADLTDPTDLLRIKDAVDVRCYKSVSWLHCVGAFKSYESTQSTDIRDLEYIFNINAMSAIFGIKIWIDWVSSLNSGNFVMFSAFSVPHAYPFMAGFNAAKAACETFVQSVSNEILADDITLNCLRVSTIDTPLERRLKKSGDIENWLSPRETAEAGIGFLLNHDFPRIRGGLIPLYKPSASFHGESVVRRFGKTSSDFTSGGGV